MGLTVLVLVDNTSIWQYLIINEGIGSHVVRHDTEALLTVQIAQSTISGTTYLEISNVLTEDLSKSFIAAQNGV